LPFVRSAPSNETKEGREDGLRLLIAGGRLPSWDEEGMSREDLKEIGEMLDESEAALIVVGEATVERAIEEQTRHAKKELKKEVRAQAKETEKATDEA
jgi:hypothetical protein